MMDVTDAAKRFAVKATFFYSSDVAAHILYDMIMHVRYDAPGERAGGLLLDLKLTFNGCLSAEVRSALGEVRGVRQLLISLADVHDKFVAKG